jgi:Holliday junction resolvase RusA-like endonuclease
MLFFEIEGIPKAQARPRATTIGGYVRFYEDKAIKDYKESVKRSFNAQFLNFKPYQNSVNVKISVYLPIPKSFSKKKTEDAIKEVIKPTSKPDSDNFAKLFCDALNGLLYKDDSQITMLIVKKLYAQSPKVIIQFWGDDE